MRFHLHPPTASSLFRINSPESRNFEMANHVSSLKRARQTVTRTAVNRANRSRVRSSLRARGEPLVKGDAQAANRQYRVTVSTLHRTCQKGVFHQNTLSPPERRLTSRVKALCTAQAP